MLLSFPVSHSNDAQEVETNLLLRCLVELALASNAPTVLKTQVSPSAISLVYYSDFVTRRSNSSPLTSIFR